MSAAAEVLSEQGLRVDGRRPGELRRTRCRLSVLGEADGSAYMEQGNTKVLATVYGPHEVRKGKAKALADQLLLNCEYSTASFSTGERQRGRRGDDRKSQETSVHLRRTFEAAILRELLPNSQLDLFVEVIQSDGGNFSACVNAATLALIDAGIPMKDYVCSCTASLFRDTPVVDLSSLEKNLGGPELTVAVLPKSGQTILLDISQRLHSDHLKKMVDLAVKGCQDVHNILDEAVRSQVAEVGSSLGLE